MATVDLLKSQIEAVFKKHKCPAEVRRVNRGYTIFLHGIAVSRIRARGQTWEVMWWSHRDKWESIGDFGGVIFDTIQEAAKYVLEDPMGIFWSLAACGEPALGEEDEPPEEPPIPPKVRPTYDAIVALTDGFCRTHLNEEYADLCRDLAAELCCKRSTPVMSGKVEAWACGVVHAVGWVNFLSDHNQTPHMKTEAVNRVFGVSDATAAAKLKTIRTTLDLIPLHPAWTLASRLEDNLLAWLVEVDGLPVDIRHLPRDAQEVAYNLGLIPFLPRQPDEKRRGGTD